MVYTIEADYRHNIDAQGRARALCYFFDCQGDTIRQLAQATGIEAGELLSAPLIGPRLTDGFSAIRTCDAQWRINKLAPDNKGNWPFWRDAIAGFWATGPLDEKTTAASKNIRALTNS